jgi:outer membrane immunogenic protein
MKKLRLSTLCLILISVPCFLISANSYSQESGYTSYDYGYGDGYEDGYDDAMDDCHCPKLISLLGGGFYAGLSAGYEGFQINRDPWYLNDRFGRLTTHANGWNGRLFGGYGYTFRNHLYLGGEAFVGGSSASGTDKINLPSFNYNGKISAGTSLGVSVLPGYRFDSGPLLYGRLGYIGTNLKVNDNFSTVMPSTTKWVSGFNTGLGIEMPLFNRLSGRIEYDYMNYSSFNNPGTTGSSNAPSDNRGSFDLILRF